MECTFEFGTSGARAYQSTKCEQGSGFFFGKVKVHGSDMVTTNGRVQRLIGIR